MPDDINWSLGFWYGVQMMFVFVILVGAYMIKVLRSRVNTLDWFNANMFGLGIMIGLFWAISYGMVVVPNIAAVLGEMGYNADKSPAGIALVIIVYFLKNTAEVARINPDSIDRSPKLEVQ